jgi:hypothetical protein
MYSFSQQLVAMPEATNNMAAASLPTSLFLFAVIVNAKALLSQR